jgi:voltage-gated potassium channel
MAEEKRANELKSTGYELFIAALSILSILNIFLAIFIPNPDVARVLMIMNGILSAIFLADFTMRLFTANSKSLYFFREFGWADLLASLPIQALKFLRIFRLFRAYRLMRRFGLKNMLRELADDRAGSALYVLLLMGMLVLEFGSMEILAVESRSSSANIKNASDALWYTLVTISTVGYGDRYPVTNPGRFIGALIIVVGVGIFGTFTGYLANLFLSPKKEPKPDQEPASTAPAADDPRARLEELKMLVADQHKSQAAVEAKLAEIEKLMVSDRLREIE